MTLSLPPLLLGMLGSLAYIAPLFGPETLPVIEDQLIDWIADHCDLTVEPLSFADVMRPGA